MTGRWRFTNNNDENIPNPDVGMSNMKYGQYMYTPNLTNSTEGHSCCCYRCSSYLRHLEYSNTMIDPSSDMQNNKYKYVNI